jgi:hypothetical protein
MPLPKTELIEGATPDKSAHRKRYPQVGSGRMTLVLFRRRRRDECSRLKEDERRRVRKSRQKEAPSAAGAVLMQIEWSKRGL